MNILIAGATSSIAQAVARELLKVNSPNSLSFVLVARNPEHLRDIQQDLLARSAKEVITIEQDLAQIDALDKCITDAWERNSGLDLVLLAHGTLPDQKLIENSAQKTLEAFSINATSHIAIMTTTAALMEKRGKGVIAAISSVAGDRGRQSNYIYGSAKGAVSLFCQGLRNRLHSSGVHVLTIKPGFVNTPMTATFDKGPLWAEPEAVAKSIVKAISRKRNVIYTPGFWFIIMTIVRSIPEFVFKKLKM